MNNNKHIKALESLDYFVLSEDEALDLAQKNNRGIVEIVAKDEYEESDYEETSFSIKSSSISLGSL